MKIVYTNGAYHVGEQYKLACGPCLTGWNDGTLKKPTEGGEACTHGIGCWQVGQQGPRGGWYPVGPDLKSMRAARLLCDTLATVVSMEPEGVR